MIRAKVKANSKTLILSIPDKYVGKKLEVIAFSQDEIFDFRMADKEVASTVLQMVDKNYKFNRDEANER